MERNRDLRRMSMAVINGIPRRRNKINNTRDSNEDDGQMELHQSLRYRDKEPGQNKDREALKRRRVDRDGMHHGRACGSNREVEIGRGDANCTDDSFGEDFEAEENGRIRGLNQMDRPAPPFNNQSLRRSLRTLRSSPALRTASDEIIGVPIPRRSRSASAKRSQDCNSGSGASGEELSNRRNSPVVKRTRGGDVGPSSSEVCLKEKMLSFSKSSGSKICDPKSSSSSRHSSSIQDDIEIEVAEALFVLRKQSPSQSQSSKNKEKFDSDSKNTAGDRCINSGTPDLSSSTLHDDGIKREKAGDDTFQVQNEQSMEVDTKMIVGERVEPMKEKFSNNTVAAISIGDDVVNKVETVDQKEKESSPCDKVNVNEPFDSAGQKEKSTAMELETVHEAKFEIDLMAPPPPSSPERDGSTCMVFDPNSTPQNAQMNEMLKQGDQSSVAIRLEEEKTRSIGPKNELPSIDIEKAYPDISSSSGAGKPHQQGEKEQKNQLQSSLLPFPIATSSLPGVHVLPNLGFMPSLQTVNPINGTARFSTAFQLPPFKLSQPRPKRCATHQYLSHNIRYHQQLVEKALLSATAAPSTLNLNSIQPTQEFFPGCHNSSSKGTNSKHKNSEAAAILDKAENRKHVLQQMPNQVPGGDFLHGPAFIFPLGNRQAADSPKDNHSKPPQSASTTGNATNLAEGPPVVNFNHSKLPDKVEMPPPRGTQTPLMPLFNGYYSMPPFSFPQTRTSSDVSSHKSHDGDRKTNTKINSFIVPNVHSVQQEKQKNLPSYSSSKSDTDRLVSKSQNAHSSPDFLIPMPPMNFALIPPGKLSSGAIGNKHGDQQKHGSNGRVDINSTISQAFSLSFGSNASTTPAVNFSSMGQNSTIFQMLPDMARYYPMATAAPMVQQNKNSNIPEGKTTPHSSNTGDGQKVILGKFSTSGVQSVKGTSVFDGSARTVNFLPIPVAGNQNFHSSTAAITSFASVNPLNFPRTTIEGISSASATSSLVNTVQRQPRHSHGQTQISFGSGFQGQNNAPASLVVGSPSNSPVSINTEPSQNGPGQKSSPVCGRNLPPILSTCPSQLSELKY